MTSRLSSMLVQDGRVTAKKMADAFQRQVIFGGTLDTILLEMGLVEPAVLSEYLARATGLQFTADLPSPEVVAVVQEGFSAALVERFHAVPLGRGPSGKLRVMVVDVPDREDPAALGQEIGRQLEVVVAPEYRFQQALEILYGVRLLPRFAKIAGKIENPAGPGAAPAATPSGPSLFAGRKPQARPGIESTPTPASRQPAAAPGAPAPNAASGMQRNSPTPAPVATATPSLVSGGQVTPAPVATPGPSLIPGGRQMTPAPVATARPGSAGAPPDDRGRPSLFDRAAPRAAPARRLRSLRAEPWWTRRCAASRRSAAGWCRSPARSTSAAARPPWRTSWCPAPARGPSRCPTGRCPSPTWSR